MDGASLDFGVDLTFLFVWRGGVFYGAVWKEGGRGGGRMGTGGCVVSDCP